MPTVISVVAFKGGAGKTTLAINVADAFRVAGNRVLLIDTDPQGSALSWATNAAEQGREVPSVVAATGPMLRKTVQELASTFDIVVIDTPARLASEGKAAMTLSHMVLVPVTPGPADIEALPQTFTAVEEVRAVYPDLPVRVVMNRFDRRTTWSGKVAAAVRESGIELLETSLGNRVAYPEAQSIGMGVCSYDPSSTAATEVQNLLAEVSTALGG